MRKEWFSGRGVDDKLERCMLRRFVLWALVLGGALGVAFYAAKLEAEEIPFHVFEQGGTTIKLMRGPCVDGYSRAFLAVAPQYLARAKAIRSVWRYRDGLSKEHAGCWFELSVTEAAESSFFLIFDDGEKMVVPKSEFLRGKGAGV